MNQTTPEQVERLIDFLADKTLSFGCRVVKEFTIEGVIGKKYDLLTILSYADISGIAECQNYHNGDIETLRYKDFYKILGHDILLGDVLAKLYELPAWKSGLIDDSEVIHTWRKLGLTRSIQDIAKDNTEESNALLQFLISIFLTEEK